MRAAPRRIGARYQKNLHSSPNARWDAEEEERERCWHTSQSFSETVVERRRSVQWHAVHCEVSCLRFTEFVRARLTEPCTRGALKSAHHSIVFLEDVTGTPVPGRVTASAMFGVIKKEFIAQINHPGRSPKQALKMLSTVLCALEHPGGLVSSSVHACLRVVDLRPIWATLRFDDHRKILPQAVCLFEARFSSLLIRSKTRGGQERPVETFLSIQRLSSLFQDMFAVRMDPSSGYGKQREGPPHAIFFRWVSGRFGCQRHVATSPALPSRRK